MMVGHWKCLTAARADTLALRLRIVSLVQGAVVYALRSCNARHLDLPLGPARVREAMRDGRA
jgi:hypothetical protein